jgi:1,4-alpha-glucan branching enzyme
MWLAECGYVPGVDELLREAAIRYFFLDAHGVLFADRPPVFGVHAPIYCRSGVAAFGRDLESSEQVWSAREGYPGDPHYREFYRDIGFDLPMDYIAPWVHPEGHRVYTGFKYHAITHAALHDKWVYDPDIARQRAGRARGALPERAAAPGRGARRPHGPPADHRVAVRRRAVRPLVVRGPDLFG